MPVHDDEHDAWLDWRRGGVTATEVADAWSGSYGGAYSVVGRKLGLIPPPEQTAAMDRGQRWQETIADAVHALTGLYVVGEETWCEHVDERRHRATVDGFLAPVPDCDIDDVTAVLEVKTTGVGVRHNLERTKAQVQWQMHVTGVPRAVIAIATIDDVDDVCDGIRIVRIDRDEMIADQLVMVADRLLVHIDAGTLPEPQDGSALDDVKVVNAVADPDADTVDLASLVEVVQVLDKTKAAIKELTDRQKAAEAVLRDAIGAATVGVCDGYRVSVSQPAMTLTAEAETAILLERPDLGITTLDRTKAKAEAPELYEAHRQPVGARRLTIKHTTEGDNR